MKKVAYVASRRLGDSLIGMVLFNNLQQHEHHVEVFGDFLYQLKDYFPNFIIHPFNDFSANSIEKFDQIITEFPADAPAFLRDHAKHICLHSKRYFKKVIHMVDVQLEAAVDIFGLQRSQLTTDLGLKIHKKEITPSRVLLCCTASEPGREWSPSKFIALANCLKRDGYTPEFIVAPNEAQRCEWVTNSGFKLNTFSSLSLACEYMVASRCFIGNASGLTHLSSALGTPTLGIWFRKGDRNHWRPYWGETETVLPYNLLWLKPLKERYWQKCVTISKVYKGIKMLLSDNHCEQSQAKNIIKADK